MCGVCVCLCVYVCMCGVYACMCVVWVSSSRSDSDSTVSPTSAPRHNVIVKNHSKRKKELVKDSAYWERRRKNNDAAKKSRDSRRQKEDDMACRAASLERENMKLRAELEQLKNETGHLRALMLAPVKAPLTLHHQLGPSSLHSNMSMIAAPSVITTTDFCGSLPHLPYTAGPQRNTVLVNNIKT
nr:Basic leucine zipper domain containing protein [Haemonchus contortus]